MNTRTRLVWASLLCVPFFSLQASATTLVVPDEFENIATAFAAASAGDTILLRPGNHVVLDEVEIPAADITIVAERPLESFVYWGFGLE